MSAAAKLNKQINDYLIQLNDKQRKAVLTIVKTFAEEQENVWEDAAFIAELDRRTAEYESGKAKVLSLNDIEIRVRKAYKAKAKPKR